MLYEMLTGKRAFEGESAASVIATILEREPAPLDLAPPLERVIRACLAKNPDQRFQNALDLKHNLNFAAEQPVPAKANRRTWIVAAAAALILPAVGGWAVSHVRNANADERVLRLQIDPPPGGRFVLGGPKYGGVAISPDGEMIAFSASVNGKSSLWVRRLDGSAARLLPDTENAGQPFWSPDSKSLGFVRMGNYLRRIDPDGGAPVTICNPVAVMHAPTWASDGSILFEALVSGGPGVYRAPASGGTPSLVMTPDPPRFTFLWPQALPGGRFLYTNEGRQPETSGVYAAPVAEPAQRVKLLPNANQTLYVPGDDGKGWLLWIRSGSLVAQRFNPRTLQLSGEPQVIADALGRTAEGAMHVAASANGLLVYGSFGELSQLAWVDRTGRLLAKIGEPITDVFMFRLSPDERHIALQQGGSIGHDLWIVDTERGISSRLTAGAAVSTQPLWSPDGRMILFTRLGTHNLLLKPANGAGDEQVVAQRSNEMVIATDWSRDGRWVLTRENSPDTGLDVWKLPMTAEGKMREADTPAPYARTRFQEGFGHFSPEPSPRWVAYTSNESGQTEVYIDAFPEPRGKKRVSTAGGNFPQWGANGRELFYVSRENKLMVVNLKLGSDTLEISVPRELFELPLASPAGPTYQPSRDGQRFLVLTSPEATPQLLNVIVNWPALLRRGAAAP
jgi:Tol biopolymer transport system component